MKTQNNKHQTTLGQVRKNVLYSGAVILTVGLFTLTTSAQNYWKQFSNTEAYGKMAALVGQSSETKNTDAVFQIINAEVSAKLNNSKTLFTIETEMEESLELEPWMTEESNFTTNFDFNALETEKNLEIEEWMINQDNFTSQNISESVETENPLKIEPWMTQEEIFNSKKMLESAEPTLEIEAWMTNENLFKNNTQIIVEETEEALIVEEWMTNKFNFNSPAVLFATEKEPVLEVESWMIQEIFFFPESNQEMPKYAQNK